MRRLAVVIITALAVACAQQDEEANVVPDTTRMLPAPATPGFSLADVAGSWNFEVRPLDKDSVVAAYQLWATADTSGWKMKFDDRNDTMKVHVMPVAGDSIVTHFGPYSSRLRSNVQVQTETVYRRQGDRLVANITAHYSVSTPDSLVYLRAEGTRAQ